MTTIGPLHRLTAALRKQASALRERGALRKPPDASRHSAAQLMTERIRALDPDDPKRRTQAIRIFLEAEFVREFGASALNDAAFGQMVDAVQAQMQQDPETAAAMERAADLLLSAAPK